MRTPVDDLDCMCLCVCVCMCVCVRERVNRTPGDTFYFRRRFAVCAGGMQVGCSKVTACASILRKAWSYRMLADCSYVSLGLVVSGEQEHEHRNMPENATRPTAAAPTIRILREFNEEAAMGRGEKKKDFWRETRGALRSLQFRPRLCVRAYVSGHSKKSRRF
jgi:hypothetical protein